MNCTIHHISDKVLYQLVLRSIQRLSSHIIADERGFAEELKSKWEAQANGKLQKQKDELQTINRRLNELDRLIFSRLVKQLSEKEGVTEAHKAENQMLWVQRMNNIRSAAMEIVSSELIYC